MMKKSILLIFVLHVAMNSMAIVPMNEWLIIGPFESTRERVFSKPFIPEETIIPNDGDMFGDFKWVKCVADKNSMVDLRSVFKFANPKQYSVAYACAYVYSEYDMSARLLLGSDDGVQAWVNGLKVWANNTTRAAIPKDDAVNIFLSKGMNCVLLRINQDKDGWGFCASIESDYPVKTVARNYSKLRVEAATDKKIWISEIHFNAGKTGFVNINLKILNSNRENISATVVLEKNGFSISDVTIDPLISENVTSKNLIVSTISLAEFLNQKDPAFKINAKNDQFLEPLNSSLLYEALIELGLSNANADVKSYAYKIKGMNLILGQPNNVRELLNTITTAIKTGKEEQVVNAYKLLYDNQASNISNRTKENIHIVGHAHLDMNWLWTTAETKKASHDNLRQTIAFMEEFPDFTMAQSQAVIFQHVEMQDPALFKKVQKYVAEGRLEPVGGMWTEGDMNLSSGEAIVRSYLLGQTYYKTKFGKTANIGWLPDNFGHPSQLAQLLKLAGCDYFYSTRCYPYAGTYWLYASDSSKVLCYADKAYYSPVSASLVAELRELSPEKKRMMKLAGVGDHGGGPTRNDINTTHLLSAVPNFTNIKFSTAQNFFSASSSEMEGRSAHKGEMNFVFEGCYTSVADIKEANRNSECMLYQSEMMAVLNWLMNKNNYPASDLNKLWEIITFNQFHDILPGTSIYEANKESIAAHFYVQKTANDIRDNAFRTIVDGIKYNTALGQPIVAFNMHSNTKKRLVEAEFYSAEKPLTYNPNLWNNFYNSNQVNPVNTGQGNVATVMLCDGKKNVYPAQVVWSKSFPPGYRSRVLFVADSIPAGGYQTFYVDASKPGKTNNVIPFIAREFETDFFKVGFDFKTGEIKRLFDKRNNIEYNSNGQNLNQLKVFMEKGGNAWMIGSIDRIEDITNVKSVTLVENGPVRACVEAVKQWGKSQIIQRTYVYQSYPRIDIELEVHWFEHATDSTLSPFLKAVFPIAISNAKFDCHVPFDVVSRPVNGQEVPAQQWVDITDGTKGLALLNSTKYGHSYNNGQLELSLMRSTSSPDHYSNMGVYIIRYSLFPHNGDWKNGVWSEGNDFNIAVYAAEPSSLSQNREKANRSEQASFISVYPSSIILSGIKQSEEGKELIIRIAEVEGIQSLATITLPVKAKKVRRLNIIEEPLQNVPLPETGGNKVKVVIKPHEIITLGIKI